MPLCRFTDVDSDDEVIVNPFNVTHVRRSEGEKGSVIYFTSPSGDIQSRVTVTEHIDQVDRSLSDTMRWINGTN